MKEGPKSVSGWRACPFKNKIPLLEYPLAVSFSTIFTFIVAVDSWNFSVLTVGVIVHYSQN